MAETKAAPYKSEFPNWDGAWPEETLFGFLALAAERRIEQCRLGGNSVFASKRLSPEETAANEAKLLRQAKAHDGYKRLASHPELRQIERERTRLAPTLPRLAGAAGELRLLRIVASLVGGFNPQYRPKRADLARKRKVRKLAAELRDSLMPGAQPSDWREASDLSKLLSTLHYGMDAELQYLAAHRTRSNRDDEFAPQRYWVEGFAKKLVSEVGEAPAGIVRSVAGMIGYAIDDRTAQRYAAEGRKRNQAELLAAALRAGTATDKG